MREKGLTLVPTRLYFKNGRAKVELALARGKEQRDKRRDIAKREADRQISARSSPGAEARQRGLQIGHLLDHDICVGSSSRCPAPKPMT